MVVCLESSEKSVFIASFSCQLQRIHFDSLIVRCWQIRKDDSEVQAGSLSREPSLLLSSKSLWRLASWQDFSVSIKPPLDGSSWVTLPPDTRTSEHQHVFSIPRQWLTSVWCYSYTVGSTSSKSPYVFPKWWFWTRSTLSLIVLIVSDLTGIDPRKILWRWPNLWVSLACHLIGQSPSQ